MLDRVSSDPSAIQRHAARQSTAPSRREGRPRVLSLAGFLLVVVVCVAPAAARFGISVPIAVRITAYVGEKPEGVNPDYDWLVAKGKDELQLYVVRLLVKNGDALPGDINQAVEPYRIKFLLAGERSALEKLMATKPGTKVVINAYLQFGEGGRYMMLDTVEPAAEPTVPGGTPEKT